MSSFLGFGGNEQGGDQQPANAVAPHPRPNLQRAFGEFQNDPGRFMQHNEVNVQGGNDPGGPTRTFFVAERQPVGTRRSSVDGSDQAVYRYHVMPQSRYEYWRTTNVRPDHDVHEFESQHIRMDPAQSDPNGGAPLFGDGGSAQVVKGRKQTYVTHPLTGCSIVRKKNTLSHLRPQQGWGGDSERPHLGGFNLQDSLEQHHPDADVFGPKQYKGMEIRESKARTHPVNPVIQSSRRGSVHIYSQHKPTIDGGGKWSARVTHTHLNPSNHRALQHALFAHQLRHAVDQRQAHVAPGQARMVQARDNQAWRAPLHNELKQAVGRRRLVADLDRRMSAMRRRLGV